MVVPSCCWTAFSLVGTRSSRFAWSSVWWFECCSGAFRHFNASIFLIFFGLVRRSVFFKDVSAGSLVFAFPTLPFSCSKVTVSPLASMFSSWQPKMRQPKHFFAVCVVCLPSRAVHWGHFGPSLGMFSACRISRAGLFFGCFALGQVFCVVRGSAAPLACA